VAGDVGHADGEFAVLFDVYGELAILGPTKIASNMFTDQIPAAKPRE